MKVTEMAQKTDKELQQLVIDTRSEIAGLLIDLQTKKVTNVKSVLAARRTLAQALTLLRERQIAEMEKNND